MSKRGSQEEIDIVAIDEIDKVLLICEVKLSKKRLDKTELIKKSIKLVDKYKGYKVEYGLYSIDDIELFCNIIILSLLLYLGLYRAAKTLQ